MLLRPLPFDEPDRLMQVAEKNDALRLPAFGASALNYLSWKEQTRTFDQLGAIQFATYTLSGHGDPETYTGNAISPSLIPLLGLQPLVGRAFTDADATVGAAPVALISETLWRRRFGGDPAVVGRPAMLNGIGYTVVGVAPRALTVLTTGDVWVPLVIDPPKEMRLNHVLFVVGRLKPGVTYRAAQAEMDSIALRVGQQYPEVKDWGINLITFTDTFVSTQLRTALLVLLGAVLFVLLIVSANVANLLLARALERQKEMAVRAALGAGRGRLLRQLLVESLVLSAIGGVGGLLAAVWGVAFLESTLPPNLLPVPDIGIDRTVVLFAAGVTLLTGIVFGLAPAWQAARERRQHHAQGCRAVVARRRAAVAAQGPGRRGAGAGDGPADWRRAARAQPDGTAARAARVRSRTDVLDVPDFAAANEVRRGQARRLSSRARQRAEGRSGRPQRRHLERHPVRRRQLHDVAGDGAWKVRPAAGRVGADRLARREPGLLRDDEDPAAARTRFHRQRYRDRAVRDDRQPGDGADVLGRRGSDRPHGSARRRRQGLHRHRHRRGRPEHDAQSRVAGALLLQRLAHVAADGRRVAHAERPRAGHGGRPPEDQGARPRAAAVEHPADDASGSRRARRSRASTRRCSASSRAWRCWSRRSGPTACSPIPSRSGRRSSAFAWRSARTAPASCS